MTPLRGSVSNKGRKEAFLFNRQPSAECGQEPPSVWMRYWLWTQSWPTLSSSMLRRSGAKLHDALETMWRTFQGLGCLVDACSRKFLSSVSFTSQKKKNPTSISSGLLDNMWSNKQRSGNIVMSQRGVSFQVSVLFNQTEILRGKKSLSLGSWKTSKQRTNNPRKPKRRKFRRRCNIGPLNVRSHPTDRNVLVLGGHGR